jgi:MFS transporter, DHA2 family, multidrug resistance protein
MDDYAEPRVNPWVVTFSVMLATFMEILDTTVVNVSLGHIAGNLAATVDEGTWVVTSYLVSNAIVLPMAGWLARRFGRRNMLLFCTAGFTAASVCCGAARSLESLIFFRILQGLAGGGMQPLSQSVLLETFPRQKHGQAMAAFGIGIILAPIIGPTLGGWITDNYSWRWIFYLNVPVGILSAILIRQFVHDPSYLRRKVGGVDLWGIGFLALGIGMLQVVLDTGQRNDWFESNLIRTYTVLCIFGLIAFVWRELAAEHPIVDLRALKDTTFSAGVFLITTVGFVLYASMVLLPIYVQSLLGYPATQAGLALSPRGLGSLCMMPITGYIVTKYDPRKLIAAGLAVGAATMLVLSHINLNSGYWDIFWPQVFQGAAFAMIMVPLMAVSVNRFRNVQMGNATSIFNLMRNIGGSFGVAVMTTFLARRNQVHINHLGENITAFDTGTRQTLAGMQAWFIQHGADPVTASRQALGGIYGMVQKHAAMLSFVEAFWLMSVMFAVMLPLVLILRRPKQTPHDEPAPASIAQQPTRVLAHAAGAGR